jgi:uncharacterized protein
MRRIALVGLGLAATMVSHLFGQESSPTASAPEIQTSGSASTTIAPNLVTLTVEFSVKRRTPEDAGRANAQRAVAIRRALVALGIPGDSIVTAGYRSEMWLAPYERDTGFIATNTVVARIRDLRLIGPAIDTSLAEGATRVADVRYSSSNTNEPYLEALKEATRLVRSRAEVMAKAAGGHLGRLIQLTTESRSYSEGLFGLDAVVATGATGTPIQARTLDVTATVHGRWEFVRE